VLGVTQEGASDTEKWVESKGVEYAYAYDKGGKLGRHFGVQGIPHAVLVDAAGTVVWKGHPGGLDDATIEKSLAGALPKPLWEWSAGAKGVKSALLKRTYKSALDQAAKLGASEGGPEILAAIQAIVKSKSERLQSSFQKGDFLSAQSTALALQKEFAGMPELADVTKVVTAIAADKNAQAVIKGQQKLAKIREGEFNTKKDLMQALDSIRKLRADYPGTYVETEADALIAQLTDVPE